jgi:hypothetical protein
MSSSTDTATSADNLIRLRLKEQITKLRHLLSQELEGNRDIARVIQLKKQIENAVGDFERHEIAVRERLKLWNKAPAQSSTITTAEWMNQPLVGRLIQGRRIMTSPTLTVGKKKFRRQAPPAPPASTAPEGK